MTKKTLLLGVMLASFAMLSACPKGCSSGKLISIGNDRKMYLECAGTGTPGVILISGYGNRADTWDAVFRELSKTTRTCAYDRPGTHGGKDHSEKSRSTPIPQPTTATSSATDLKNLLEAAHESGPFVIAGHSYGGPIARIFINMYPEKVAGLVLVDALSEDLRSGFTDEDWKVYNRLNEPQVHNNPDYEEVNWDGVFKELSQISTTPSVPVIILTADQNILSDEVLASAQLPPGVNKAFADALWAAQLKAQQKLAARFPGAKHITDTHADHNIQTHNPQIVIDSVREVLAKTRK